VTTPADIAAALRQSLNLPRERTAADERARARTEGAIAALEALSAEPSDEETSS